MSRPPSADIVCEGYHDRAFWSGLLKRSGFAPLQERREGERSGVYRFARGQTKVRVLPAGGDSGRNQPARLAADILLEIDPPTLAIAGYDSDRYAPDDSVEHRRQALHDALTRKGLSPQEDAATGEIRTSSGSSVRLVVWRTDDPADTPGVPNKQTLERVIASALAEVSRERAAAVEQWLLAAPPSADDSEKRPVWSYVSKWYPCSSYEGSIASLCADDAVFKALKPRLARIGVMALLDAL